MFYVCGYDSMLKSEVVRVLADRRSFLIFYSFNLTVGVIFYITCIAIVNDFGLGLHKSISVFSSFVIPIFRKNILPNILDSHSAPN